ncbi:MAG: rhomboid family intramembrane serine protease [Acidobacteria bacterium]|nr:rhomboid family intramembrane serine protease [Acidobacteriota bacterium]
MLIPYGHTGAIRKMPIITIALIVINTVVFLMTMKTIEVGQGSVITAEKFLLQYEIQIMQKYDHETYKNIDEHAKNLKTKNVRKELNSYREKIKSGDVVPKDSIEYKQWEEKYKSLERSRENAFLYTYGYVPGKKNYLGIFTSMYLHAGWFHLIFNMLFLWVAGSAIEDKWGIPFYIVFYHIGGIVAGLIHGLSEPTSMIPSLGASGAISALMGAFLIRHYKFYIKFIFFLGYFIKFKIRAYYFLPFWIGEQLLFASVDIADGGTAFWAHIGGFFFGMIFAAGVVLIGIEDKYLSPRLAAGSSSEGAWKKEEVVEKDSLDHNLQVGKDLMARGKYDDAIISINAALTLNPNNLDAMKVLYYANIKIGEIDEAVKIAEKMCEILQIQKKNSETLDVHREVKKIKPTNVFSMRVQFGIAQTYQGMGFYPEAARAYYEFAVAYPETQLATKALFTAGEIILHKLKNKMESYKIFSYLNQRYPNQQYSDKTREYLNYLSGGSSSAGR